MSEKNKNRITVLIASIFIGIGLLYTFDPDGDFQEAILKVVELPRSIFSFFSDNKDTAKSDKTEDSGVITSSDGSKSTQKKVTSFNPNETPLDSFNEHGISNQEDASSESNDPTEINGLPANNDSTESNDSTEINELPIHRVDQDH